MVIVWRPLRTLAVTGEVHGANAALSSAHSKVAPGSSDPNSNATLTRLRLVLTFGFGALVMVVSGAWVSGTATVKLCDAGDASTLPFASMARASSVCGPLASGAVVWGLVHG